MAITAKKPAPTSAEEFLSGGKAEVHLRDEMEQKTFLLRMPKSLWKTAKAKAQEEEITLHEYILRALKKDIQ